MLAAWYPELKIRITNSGTSGNTSHHLLARFDRDVVSLNPQWVSICIRINDVWRQFDSPAISTDIYLWIFRISMSVILKLGILPA